MSFVKNSNQQMNFDDSLFNLTEREHIFLEKSWAKYFAERIFPKIDETKFGCLYSSESASRPNTPVNVIVGALILKEFLNLTDDELMQSLMFDIRLQYALHTTSFTEQPLSDRTLSRFRARLLLYESQTGIDLIHECVVGLANEISELMNISLTNQRMDSLMIAASIRNLSLLELFYKCVENMIKAMLKRNKVIPENLFHYTEENDFNKVVYHQRSTDVTERINKVLAEALQLSELCSGEYDDTEEYQLLLRLLKEQTIEESGEYRLRKKGEFESGSRNLINPADPEATFKMKANKKNIGYVANITESVNESGSVITEYQYDQNIHSDVAFVKEYMENRPDDVVESTIVADGAYGSDENIDIAKDHNIKLVTTNFSGVKPEEFYAEFVISEDGKTLIECANHQKPIDCRYNEKERKCIAYFTHEACEKCPYKENCNPKVQTKRMRKDISRSRINHARHQRFMKTENYREIAHFRNGVEAIMSLLRRKYHADKMPVHGKLRTKLYFGFKVAALNFSKLLGYLSSSSLCSQKLKIA